MGDQPIIVAPAISVIVAELRKRPEWRCGEPFAVPSDLYQAARDEMKAIMKKRGWPLPSKDDSFLIYGTVIVPNG